ncbi:MaoC/PaaZ C-terminal domain-containing protein [Prauserella cavernicola]|uniref:MaoC family dehydratase N-terminal domain-containing protein n=1 Tax=Prauserella cavernicola TaxID=2800127 RepID=A0A934V8U7_9PSEU|nr:MaoC/PaaZ C-terminal domain-containing protein [Prauserella cavernicola]MBK1789039.1 MaoC family dehydratase N-terminal domain-containing protein [Prauserella cavernicola]
MSLTYDDLRVGLTFDSPSRTITESDVVSFAGLTGDFFPLHTSEEYAKGTEYGTRVAHGLLGLSYAHGLMWARTGALDDCIVAFLGIGDWRFTGAIHLGDTIHVRYSVAELRPSRSRRDRAVVVFAVEVLNQRDEVVQQGTKSLLLSR